MAISPENPESVLTDVVGSVFGWNPDLAVAGVRAS